ncbi:MAG: hypothetical protein WAZ94_07305 [Phycisphaerales bacterium]|nr:hypothetical protein [Phycisphaerales bacterium]
MPQSTSQQKTVNKPVHVVRYGSIKAAVWLNQTSAGPMHNVTISRTYKDGDDWKESGSFGADDLLSASKALDAAHTWIFAERERSRDGQDR